MTDLEFFKANAALYPAKPVTKATKVWRAITWPFRMAGILLAGGLIITLAGTSAVLGLAGLVAIAGAVVL